MKHKNFGPWLSFIAAILNLAVAIVFLAFGDVFMAVVNLLLALLWAADMRIQDRRRTQDGGRGE